MTIPLTGAGGLYTRLGHLFGALADANALRGGAATARVLSGANLATRVNTVEADYAAGTAVQQLLDGIFGNLTAVQGGLSSLFSDYATRAQNTLKAMYSIDQGVGATAPASVLTASDLTTALRALISQMTTAAASVNASVPAVGAQTAVGTPQGNPVFVFSVKNPQGQTLQYALAETLTAAATTDSQSGGTLGNEGFSVRGQVAVSDVWSPLWPGGSGASYSGNLADGSKSNATGNLLTNSDFTAFVGNPNLPDNWTALVGTPGTDVFNGTAGGAYTTGGGALQFTGTAGTLLDAVTQTFGTPTSTTAGAGGTPAVLKPDTQYAGNVWIKTSATPTAGAAEFSLVDGSNAVVNDDQAVANLATRTLTNVGTTYVNFNFVFRTPAVLPSALKLRVRLSTAIDSGKSVYFGRLAFREMAPVYAGGPHVAGFSGSAKVIAGNSPDAWTFAVTQTWGLFQQYFERVFGMKALGLTLPNSGTPTVADTLIA
jgi:hypothetical protein